MTKDITDLLDRSQSCLSPKTQFLFGWGFKRFLLTGLPWDKHPVTFLLLNIYICMGKSLLEAKSRTVVRLARVPKITEWFYQNSALAVPAATEESKTLCTAKLRGTTCMKCFKSEHELSNGCNLSSSNGFSTQRRLEQESHSSKAETKQLLVKKWSRWPV